MQIENYNITSDKIVSLLEIEKINRSFDINKCKTILEIGAGSGRTADAILSIYPSTKYVICDIPPALFISYKRLKLRFPEKKIYFCSDDNIINAINENDIILMFPHNLQQIKNSIDLILAIDCLHEMNNKTIDFYLKNFSNISKNLFCTVWKRTTLPYSKHPFKFLYEKGLSKAFYGPDDVLDFEKGDYNIPKNWQLILKEKLEFPSNHIALAYKIV